MISKLSLIAAFLFFTLIAAQTSLASASDGDHDGFSDAVEISLGTNPFDASSFPLDSDRDFIPDALDSDDDDDGVPDIRDAFPFDPAEWTDTDRDSIGNNADMDDDDDCYMDVVEHNERTNPINPASRPFDHDRDCDPNTTDPDDDNDGVADARDAFPLNAAEWADNDADGVGDNADLDDDGDGVIDPDDAFSFDPAEEIDADGDGVGDNADTDDDNDGVNDLDDIFPFDPAEWSDIDGDGVGDNHDPDTRSFGFEAGSDLWECSIAGPQAAHYQRDGCEITGPAIVSHSLEGAPHIVVMQMWLKILQGGDISISALDDKGVTMGQPTSIPEDAAALGKWTKVRIILDATREFSILYVNDALVSKSGEQPAKLMRDIAIQFAGSVHAYLDDISYALSIDLDGDGLANDIDTDDDNDGVPDELDAFPLDKKEWADDDQDSVGNNADTDDDGDGVADGADALPLDPLEWADDDGDGIGDNADPDDDGDAIPDESDSFPLAASESTDSDSDGIGDNADMDDDDDGLSDVEEIRHATDHLDVDSDDDGVIDGDEIDPFGDTDGDRLIDALDPDSDGDGIMDGTEMGITKLRVAFQESLPKSLLGTQRGSPYLVLDMDPSTTTSPIKIDSDSGGLSDGREDSNHNGRLERGERDPANSYDDALPDNFSSGGCALSPSDEAQSSALLVLLVLSSLIAARRSRLPNNG